MITTSIKMKITIQAWKFITNNFMVILTIYGTQNMLQALCLGFNIQSARIEFHFIFTITIWVEPTWFYFLFYRRVNWDSEESKATEIGSGRAGILFRQALTLIPLFCDPDGVTKSWFLCSWKTSSCHLPSVLLLFISTFTKAQFKGPRQH